MSEILLRPLKKNDEFNIIRWRNSEEVKKHLYTQTELTLEIHRNWFETQVSTRKCYQFIIEIIESKGKPKPIGTVYIKNIDNINLKGEYGIYIGEPEERGKGYSTIIMKKILDFAFSELKLNRIYLTAFYDNLPSINAALKAGFEREAVFIDEILRSDGYADIVYMGINKEQWERMKGECNEHT